MAAAWARGDRADGAEGAKESSHCWQEAEDATPAAPSSARAGPFAIGRRFPRPGAQLDRAARPAKTAHGGFFFILLSPSI